MNQGFRITGLSLLLTLLSVTVMTAQGWKAHYRLAEKKEKRGDLMLAAFHYEAAYRLKPKRKIAYKAAETYYAIKDFRRAANMYSKILDQEKHFPLIRLKYARCLKQSGQYEQAIREFVFFINHYKGPDREVWDRVVDKEIEGCALGLSYSDNSTTSLLNVEHLPSGINTPAIEMSPIPVNNNLYFSSLRSGEGRFYRAIQGDDGTLDVSIPPSFPKMEEGIHFGSGSLSPDARRFYFTKCKNSHSLRATCRIHVTVRQSDGWSKPRPLGDYINWPGSTTTHPFVTAMGGKEYLFFASDREGGQGGLDLYVAERDLTSPAFDFTFPRNLGHSINTPGDEETPFYSTDEEALYFSSDGLVSMGGLDVFKAAGTPEKFGTPVNLGAPINSPADDAFFVKTGSGDRGYFVSNRIFGSQKITTTDEDIFAFNFSPNQFTINGYVLDEDHQIIKKAEVALYEQNGNGELIFLTGTQTLDGHFKFAARLNKNYVVEVEKEGFPVKTLHISTFGDVKDTEIVKDVVLTNDDTYDVLAAVDKQIKSGVGTSAGAITTSKGVPAETGKSGTYYKIQLAASKVDADLLHPKYVRIKALGKIEKTYIPARDLYWITLGDYSDFKEAVRNLAKAKNRGFADAFIVKYRNGKRIGQGK